jgi:hypothetical protein
VQFEVTKGPKGWQAENVGGTFNYSTTRSGCEQTSGRAVPRAPHESSESGALSFLGLSSP